MSTQNKNQSRLNQNKLNNQNSRQTSKLRSLPYILEIIASDPELQQQAVINILKKIYHQLCVDIVDLRGIRENLKHQGKLYSIEDAAKFLKIIVLNASFGAPSYISHGKAVAKVSEIDDNTKVKLGINIPS